MCCNLLNLLNLVQKKKSLCIIVTIIISLIILFESISNANFLEPSINNSKELTLPKLIFTNDENIIQINTNFSTNNKQIVSSPTPIFFNDYKFQKLLEYYNNHSSSHPSSLYHLHEQLFCPLKHSFTFTAHDSVSNAQEIILRKIYELQFAYYLSSPLESNFNLNTSMDDKEREFCVSNKNSKYLILNAKAFGQSGLGAITNGPLIKYLYRAILSNRTLLLNGKWQWSSPHAYCSKYIAMECYFLPISNCNKYVDEIIRYAHGDILIIKGEPRKLDCNFGDFGILDKTHQWCKQRVIYAPSSVTGQGYYPLMSEMNKVLIKLYFCNYQCFRAIAIAFLYRLRANVRTLIYAKIQNAFKLSLKNNVYHPLSSISLAIRSSDKCKHDKRYKGEMECWTAEEYARFLYSAQVLSQNTINSVILTSESTSMIKRLKEMLVVNHSYGEWIVIENFDDVSPGIGAAWFYDKRKTIDDVHEFAASDLEHDVIVSALSSLLLQISSAKYTAFTRSSNWIDNIWSLSWDLSCEAIFWSEQFLLNVEMDIGHEMQFRFIRNIEQHYYRLERQCFELKQHGINNKKIKWKHILYPPDLWTVIRMENIYPLRFKKRFGVAIDVYGWDKYCQRYMEPPFIGTPDII